MKGSHTKSNFRPNSNLLPYIFIFIEKIIDDPDYIRQMRAIISHEENKRAESFYFEKDHNLYICAHSKLRIALSRYAEKQPQNLEFKQGPYGKPYLKNNSRIRFNLSHSEEMIAIAITMDRNIGVDIEKKAQLRDLSLISANIMSQKELREFNACESCEQKNFFYRCWVRKEAAVKAMGMGVTEDLRKIPTTGEKFNKPELYSAAGIFPIKWKIEDVEVNCEHACAVCVEGNAPEIKIFFDQLAMPL